jgi:hypothetical protein
MYIKNITKEKIVLLSNQKKNKLKRILIIVYLMFFLSCKDKQIKKQVKIKSPVNICQNIYNKKNVYLRIKLERCEYKLKDILRSSYKER